MGQVPRRAIISTISNSLPCVIGTVAAHGYENKSFIRLTNLNGAMPSPHGADQLNNNRYRIIVTGDQSFTLQDPITFRDIDSTNFPVYTEGGLCNLIEHNYVYVDNGDNDGQT